MGIVVSMNVYIVKHSRKLKVTIGSLFSGSTLSMTLKTTIYSLLAPMAAFRVFQSKFTQFDLSLDPYITLQ
jgi:hypothetical protein